MVIAHRLLYNRYSYHHYATLMFFIIVVIPEDLRSTWYLKVLRIYLQSAIFLSRLYALFFPLKHSLYATSFFSFTCTKLLMAVLCDVFFYRCVTCVVCECTAWFAVVVKVVYSQSITITAKVTCIITCRLTSCPKCVLFILFVAERPVVSKYEV